MEIIYLSDKYLHGVRKMATFFIIVCRSWAIRQDSTFWSLKQMFYWVRGEKLLAVPHFIFFLRILQKLSNILHPSRQNWTTEVCFFLQKDDNSWKYLSQLLLTSCFILVCLNENFWRLLILFLHGFTYRNRIANRIKKVFCFPLCVIFGRIPFL